MRIEDEIKVKHFVSQEQKLSINLIYTSSWADEKLKAFFSDYKLTSQQYNVLRILRGQYPNAISTAGISERMIHKMSNTSRIVDRLYKKALVIKKTCEKDKRLVDVIITEKARELLKKMDAHAHRIDAIYSKLSKNEIELVSTLLDKLRG